MNPPLRAESDRQALLDALRDGTIACIATDHAPHARHEKDAPFEEAPFGVTGLETAFAALYTQPRRSRASSRSRRCSSGCPRARREPSGSTGHGSRSARARTSSLLDLERRVAGDGGAASARARRTPGSSARRSAASSRPWPTAAWCSRHERGLPPRSRTARSSAAARSARRAGVRRSGVHDRDDRLPGDGHRPELRGAARLLHGADGRQLRRCRDALESAAAHATGSPHARAGGEEWARLAAEHGLVALDGHRHARARPALREAGSMRAAAVADESDTAVEAALAAVRAQPAMEGRALVARVSTPSRTSSPRADAVASRSSTTARSDRSCGGSRSAGAAVTVFPHDADPDELASFDGVLLSNGPGDPEPLSTEVEVDRGLLGRVPRPRDLPRPPAARPRHRARDVQAAVRPPRREPPGARARHRPRPRDEPEPRVRSRACDEREATHVSLYDGTVEGFDFPELRARSVQFHPEAGPGPHDAWPILERWVEELRPLMPARRDLSRSA